MVYSYCSSGGDGDSSGSRPSRPIEPTLLHPAHSLLLMLILLLLILLILLLLLPLYYHHCITRLTIACITSRSPLLCNNAITSVQSHRTESGVSRLTSHRAPPEPHHEQRCILQAQATPTTHLASSTRYCELSGRQISTLNTWKTHRHGRCQPQVRDGARLDNPQTRQDGGNCRRVKSLEMSLLPTGPSSCERAVST